MVQPRVTQGPHGYKKRSVWLYAITLLETIRSHGRHDKSRKLGQATEEVDLVGLSAYLYHVVLNEVKRQGLAASRDRVAFLGHH
jgi:hypothetical protein